MFDVLFSWQFLLMSLAVSAMVQATRQAVSFWPPLTFSRLWSDLALPLLPLLYGAAAGWLAVAFPYPEGLQASAFGRVTFGLVAGLASASVYRAVKATLASKSGDGYAA